MSVVITGASGFAGRYLGQLLHGKGKKNLVLLHNKYSLTRLGKGASCERVDLGDSHVIEKILRKHRPKEIYHLAALVKAAKPSHDSADIFRNNVMGTINLFEAVRHTVPNARILNVGSSYVYGNAGESSTAIRERAPLSPKTPYGLSKLCQEQVAQFYTKKYGLRIILTRTFYYAGPGQDQGFLFPNLIHKIVKLTKSTEHQLVLQNLDDRLDYTDIRDVVSAYYLLMKFGRIGEVYNVCSGRAKSVRRFVKTMVKNVAIPIQVKTEVARPSICYVGSCAKLRKLTGWKPKISISKTIRDMFEYVKGQQS